MSSNKYTESCMKDVVTALIYFVGIVAFSDAVAALWIFFLDKENDPGDLNLTALNSLNLIVGFLYVNLISHARSEWTETMKHVNNFSFAYKELDSSKLQKEEKLLLKTIRKRVYEFYAGKKKRKKLTESEKVTNFTQVLDALRDLKASTDVSQLRHCSIELMRPFFEEEPWLFTYHLYAVLFIYFGSIPVQLFNAYDSTTTYILYPIIIYLLFSVALYAKAFHNPVQHPELCMAFERLNEKIHKETIEAPSARMLYSINGRRMLRM